MNNAEQTFLLNRLDELITSNTLLHMVNNSYITIDEAYLIVKHRIMNNEDWEEVKTYGKDSMEDLFLYSFLTEKIDSARLVEENQS